MTHPPRSVHATGLIGSTVALFCTTLAFACSSGAKSGGTPDGGQASGGATASTGGTSASTGGTSSTGGASTSTGGAPAASGGSGGAGTGSGGTTGGTTGGTGGASAGGGSSNNGGHSSTGGTAGPGGMSGGAGGNTGSAGAQWSSTFPKFTKHTIATFSSGYATAIADVDHDGKPDVIALSSASAGVVWFKNPSWTKYTVTTKAKAPIFLAPYDVDGDGDLDVAVASDFSMTDTMGGGTISWAEAPADPTQNQDWTLHKIDAIPTTHRLRWADLDGDGKKELIALPIFGVGSDATTHAGAVQMKAFTIPKDLAGTWTSKVLDSTHLETAHALTVVDWDGDKAEDLLTAANDGVDLFRPSLGSMAEHVAAGATGQAPNKGSSEAVLGSLGGAHFIATIDPWHGTDVVVYTPGASATAVWTRQVVGAGVFTHGHGMVVADLNGDGFDEFVGGGGQGTMAQIIFRYVPSTQKWDMMNLDVGGVAVSCMDARDMDGDGDIDIVSMGGNDVVWYENMR